MRISFSFSGYICGTEIKKVTVNATGEELDVSTVSPSEIVTKLESGEWSISLGDHLYNGRKSEIEIFDFEQTKD